MYSTAILRGFKWLCDRGRHPFLIYGLIAAAVLIPVTVFGDLYSFSRGTLAFGKGYTIVHDVIVGQVMIWAPVVFYTLGKGVGGESA